MADLRIVMMAPFGIRPKGTLSARMLPLAQALTRRGYSVRIVAPPVQNPQDAGSRVLYDGVPVTHTTAPRAPGPIGVAQQVLALLGAALAERPDVLHLFKPKGYSGLATLLARRLRPKLPLVVDTDDWEGWGGWNDLLPYPMPAKRLFAWQERDLPRRADAVTVASRTLETQVWGFGVARDRVFYLPNGVAPIECSNVPTFQRSNVPTMVLYTRFWEFDVRDLVAALVGITAQCPTARLLVIGRGERGEERELMRRAERAGIDAVIENRGWVAPEQIPVLLASADLAIVPMDDTLINRARGLAKLLELMAARLPIVAGQVGQVAEYIEDGRSGLLVRPQDLAALAQAALRLIANHELRARLGEAARQRAIQSFSWDRLAQQAEVAYRRAGANVRSA